MHTDENKRFDKRNIEKNIKSGIISKKDYEHYLSKLPESSEKAYNPEEFLTASETIESTLPNEIPPKKRVVKKKKGK